MVGVGLTSCGETAEPVASVAVGLDRDELPRGRHLTMRYRFGVFPSLGEIRGDYKVLVHFLNGDGEVMWQDDHYPPVDLENWVPGRTIEYDRRMIVPLYPYIGEAEAVVGIYSPSTGERLPLLGNDLGNRTYRGFGFRLVPEHESSMLFYDNGWHGEEYDAVGSERWRWTAERATLTFRNPRTDAVLYLEVQGGAEDLVGGQQFLGIRHGDTVLHGAMLAGRTFLAIEMRRDAMGEDPTVRLDFAVEPSFVPAALGRGLADERRLGVRVYYVYVDVE